MLFADHASAEIREIIRQEIAETGGQEVLFTGKVDSNLQLLEIEAVARGCIDQVPAPAPHTTGGDVIIHNHPSGQLIPSPADIRVASQLGQLGIGFYIIDNEAENVYVVTKPIPPRTTSLLNSDDLAATIDAGGRLSQIHPAFEARESQIEMLQIVSKAFNTDSISLIEAGTGVGKSYAYLLPALAWAHTNDERVVVSTATINLQQQLMEKDIPAVQRILDTRCKTVLIKGRSNYVCQHRLAEQLEENRNLFEDVPADLQAIADWAATSDTGDKANLPFLPEAESWSTVCADADSCTGRRCRYHDSCFLIKARKEAASAQILVANHHLLFADIALRDSSSSGFSPTLILPGFHRLIMDEAHNIERSATSYFSRSFSRLSLRKYLRMLYRQRRGSQFGPLLILEQLGVADISQLPPLIRAIETSAEMLDASAQAVMGTSSTLRIMGNNSPEETTEQGVLQPLLQLHKSITTLTDILKEAFKNIPDSSLDEPEVVESRSLCRRLEDAADVCKIIGSVYQQTGSQSGPARDVFWLERKRTSKNDPYIQFTITPLHVGPILQEKLFEPLSTVVCCSATLTIRSSFRFFDQRMGISELDPERVTHASLPSPFNYPERVLLGIPADAPEPSAKEDYTAYLADFIPAAIEASGGSALVLFTSYSLLQEMYEQTVSRLRDSNLLILKQGDDHRARLLERFNRDESSVLFATQSFWEGVDAPGNSLRLLIITRLPFPVPSEPIHQARCDALEAEGKSSFMHLSVPEAIMRFTQGFGRLMRTATDHGVVIVSDTRIQTKRYGSLFLQSLPETRRSQRNSDELLPEIQSFLASMT